MNDHMRKYQVDTLAEEDLQLLLPLDPAFKVNRAEALGAVTVLWFQSSFHGRWPVQVMSINVCPALEHRQFLILRHKSGLPLLYASWAWLDLAREHQYLSDPLSLKATDWISGDRMWIIDWIAPYGGSRRIATLLRRKLFTRGVASALRVKEGSSIGRIHHHFGSLVSAEERGHLLKRMTEDIKTMQGAQMPAR